MANSYFQFKQFLIHQERCAMKISTDSVLLGALADQSAPKFILDIGAGTGVIGLMLAQRFEKAMVHGVELDDAAFGQAKENFVANSWKTRMEMFHGSFQKFAHESTNKYDLVVSNPPYFSNHLQARDPKRNLALHHQALTFEDLWIGVDNILDQSGVFWVILPNKEMEYFQKHSEGLDFCVHSKFRIRDRPAAKVHREVCSFKRGELRPNEEVQEICIKDGNGNYSTHYRTLLKEFMLNF